MTNDGDHGTHLGVIHDDIADASPNRTAIINGSAGSTLTYGEFAASVARAANALEDLGVERTDRVVLCYPNEVRYLVTLLATVRVGAVPVPLNLELGRETIAYILDDCGASILLGYSAETVSGGIEAAIEETPGIEVVVVDTESIALSLSTSSVIPFRRRTRTADPTHAPADVDASDPAMQPYTSGTTGDPKGIVLSHSGVSWCTRSFVGHLGLSPDERGLVVTPLYHKNAMTGVVKPMLESGGSFVLLRDFDSERVLQAIDEYDVTYMTGVPAIYKRLVAETENLDPYDVSSLAWASCGSAPVPASLVESFGAAFGADLLEVYGLTEGGPVVTHSPRDGPRKIGSAGVALPGVETLILNPNTGDPVPARDTGELLVASPGLGTYHDRPDANRSRFEIRDGVRMLHTGDLAKKDMDGYHYIVGRLDDMMIVGGENLSPADVEDLLLKHDAVEDVAVVRAPHAEKGEAPVAFVVRNSAVTEDELRQFALDHGPVFAHPRRVFFETELPLSGTGKVEKTVLRSQALDRIDGEL